MIRSFVYGFIIGFYEKIEREERENRTIGSLVGFLCSCIAIGWLVYCFKF